MGSGRTPKQFPVGGRALPMPDNPVMAWAFLKCAKKHNERQLRLAVAAMNKEREHNVAAAIRLLDKAALAIEFEQSLDWEAMRKEYPYRETA